MATRLSSPTFLSVAMFFAAWTFATGFFCGEALAMDKGGAKAAAPKTAGQKTPGYMLRQRSRAEGAMEIYIGKSCLRMEITKTNFILVSAAPWREVTMYCTLTHNYYKCPLDQIRNPYLKLRNMYDGGAMTDLPLVPKGEGKLCDLKTKVFVQKADFEMAQLKLRHNHLVASRAPKRVKYQTTAALKCDPQVGFILSRFDALPETNDVPLELAYVDVENNDKIEMETTTVKRTEISTSNFSLPAGYNKVKDALQVIVPDNKDGELDMMMFGSKQDETKKAGH